MTDRPNLSNFRAVTFDFYGTIVDWEPEILAFLRRWTDAQGLSTDDATLLETYDRLRRPIQDERPAWRYPDVLRRTLDAMAHELGCDLPRRCATSSGASPRRIARSRTAWRRSAS